MSSHKKANRSLGAQMSIWRFSLYGGAVFSGVIVRALCPFVAKGPASNAFINSDLRLISEQLFEERLPERSGRGAPKPIQRAARRCGNR